MEGSVSVLGVHGVQVNGLVVEEEGDDVEVRAAHSQVEGTRTFLCKVVLILVRRLEKRNKGLLITFSQRFEQLEAIHRFSHWSGSVRE